MDNWSHVCIPAPVKRVARCASSGYDLPGTLERDDRERDGSRPEDHVCMILAWGRAVALVARLRGRVHRPRRAVARSVAPRAAPA